MRGVITGKDVLLHSVTILRFWGLTTYLQCLRAAISRKQTTFLGVLYPAPARALEAPFERR